MEMKIYERWLQALLSSAPRSRVLARLASLAQIGELARRLPNHPSRGHRRYLISKNSSTVLLALGGKFYFYTGCVIVSSNTFISFRVQRFSQRNRACQVSLDSRERVELFIYKSRSQQHQSNVFIHLYVFFFSRGHRTSTCRLG